jgi:Fe-S-cluster containining protein
MPRVKAGGERKCGECRMCCKVFPLPVLDKPGNQWCEFLSSSGCSIHDHGQPEVCRQYACFWLEHEEMPEEYRPDKIGIVVTECGWISVAGESLRAFVLNQSEPEACGGTKAWALIGSMVARGWVLLVVCGPEMHIAYDRTRYASISDAQIEVAFRYEQSQDAEELKRLGAVNEDYRSLTRAEAEATIGDQICPRKYRGNAG